jgi:hypothetical protein
MHKRTVAGVMIILATGGLATASLALGAGGSRPALFNRITYNYSSALNTAQEAARYKLMVMQSSDASAVAALHAANPGLKIFMYQNALSALSTDPTGLTSCTPYGSDTVNQPSWFLKDQNGHRIVAPGYANSYLMDVGNTVYQKACVAHAVALAKQYGFNGVFFDGYTASLSWTVPVGTTVPEYPTNQAWQAATYALIAYTGAAAGLPVIGNIGGSTLTPGLWQKWTTPIAGSAEESWTDGGAGLSQQLPAWPTKLANAAWSEAHGKIAILHSWNSSETGNTYGLASMLLVANGSSTYSTSNTNYVNDENWYPEYGTSQQLGAASGTYFRLANGVYERVFANGIVLVNPSVATVGRFSLGGGIYTGSRLTSVTSVSMASATGLVLLRVG